MKYFITGGAGFIGCHMAEKLVEMGNDVTVFDNLCSGTRERVAHLMNKSGFKLVVADLLDKERVVEEMKGHDFIIHFAANPDIAKALKFPDIDLKLGIIAGFNVLDAMRLNGIKKIAYPSGSGIYGDVGDTYTAEDFGPLLPISMYGASKLGVEGLMSAFCHMYDMQSWMFRFANVIGDRQTHGVTLDFVNKLRKNPAELEILGDGSQSKSYVHVSEIIKVMLFCIENGKESVNVFNVANNDFIDVTGIANVVVEEMGLENVEFKYTGGKRGWKGDVPIVRLDVKKLESLGFKVKMGSKDAVRKTVKEILEES